MLFFICFILFVQFYFTLPILLYYISTLDNFCVFLCRLLVFIYRDIVFHIYRMFDECECCCCDLYGLPHLHLFVSHGYESLVEAPGVAKKINILCCFCDLLTLRCDAAAVNCIDYKPKSRDLLLSA